MAAIFRIDENDMPWTQYSGSADPAGYVGVRVKALTVHERGVPLMQYVEYAPGHTDPIHSHDTDEVFIVIEGELWLDDAASAPGSVVFIPRDTEYAVHAGDEGVRFFRVVFPRSLSEDRGR
jgi:quercetin dioxygenase-like cupin family protein